MMSSRRPSSHSCRTGRCKLGAAAVVADCIGPPGTSSLQRIGFASAGALDRALRQAVVPFRYIEHDLPRLGVGHDFGYGPSFFGAAPPVFDVIEQRLHRTPPPPIESYRRFCE